MEVTFPLGAGAAGISVVIDGVTYQALRQDASGNLLIAVALITPATAVASAQAKIAVGGTAVQLPNLAAKGIAVRALNANAGKVYLGPSTVTAANGYELAAGQGVDLALSNANLLWLNGPTVGDGVSLVVVS